MTAPAADVVVVGGGHNGLTCAAYLARAGVDTVLVEQNEVEGGALSSSRWEGHLLEHGAVEHTAVLTSGVIDELDLAAHGLEYHLRDVAGVHLFGDGRQFTIAATADATAASIAEVSPHDADAWLRLSALSAPLLGALAIASDGWVPPPEIATTVARVLGGRAASELVELTRISAVELADEWFESSHIKALAIFRCSFLGLPPWSPGSAVAFLFTVGGHGRRLGRPIGGSPAFVAALSAAAMSYGAVVRRRFRVGSIERTAAGWTVRSDGGEQVVARRAVVSAIPPPELFLRLLSGELVPRRLRRRLEGVEVVAGNVSQLTLAAALDSATCIPSFDSGVTAATMLWLLGDPVDAVDTYRAIARGEVPASPGTLVAFPTAADPSQAPQGRATMWANAVTTYRLAGADWDGVGDRAAAGVWRTIDRCLPGVHGHAVHEVLTTPDDFERATGAANPGNHVAPTLAQTLGRRPVLGLGNYSTPLAGVFVTGAGTHPGGGVNGASGRACAEAVLRWLGGGRRGWDRRRVAAVARQLGASVGAARRLRTLAGARPPPDPLRAAGAPPRPAG